MKSPDQAFHASSSQVVLYFIIEDPLCGGLFSKIESGIYISLFSNLHLGLCFGETIQEGVEVSAVVLRINKKGGGATSLGDFV